MRRDRHGLDVEAQAETGLASGVEIHNQPRVLFDELWGPALARLG